MRELRRKVCFRMGGIAKMLTIADITLQQARFKRSSGIEPK